VLYIVKGGLCQGNLGQGSLLISTEVIVWMEEGVGGGTIVMVG
jgi:hypothetical protein